MSEQALTNLRALVDQWNKKSQETWLDWNESLLIGECADELDELLNTLENQS